MLNGFEETWSKFISNFIILDVEMMCFLSKSFLVENKCPFILNSQKHACSWTGNRRKQGMSIHDIDIILQDYSVIHLNHHTFQQWIVAVIAAIWKSLTDPQVFAFRYLDTILIAEPNQFSPLPVSPAIRCLGVWLLSVQQKPITPVSEVLRWSTLLM